MFAQVLLLCLALYAVASSGFCFNGMLRVKSNKLMMIDLELNTATYAAIAFSTIVPSIALVKFVGDQVCAEIEMYVQILWLTVELQADSSRGSLSDKTKEKFKRAMMEQPGANLALPTSEEEALKKAIAKAYMQDKDVDVAILEDKLR